MPWSQPKVRMFATLYIRAGIPWVFTFRSCVSKDS